MSSIDGEASVLSTFIVNGVHTPGTPATVKANSVAASCYTFSTPYNYTFRGAHLSFRKGHTYSLDAAEKVALLASAAPMVAA